MEGHDKIDRIYDLLSDALGALSLGVLLLGALALPYLF